MDSTELDAEIEEHNEDHEPFTCDYASAQGGSSLNPFLARDGTAGGSGGSGTSSGVSPAPSSPSSSAPAGGDSDAASGPSVATINAMTAAHGAIAAVTFLVLFPAGSFVLRIPGLGIWFHAAIQIFSYCCFITAAGIGIYLANMEAILSNYHPIVGIIVLGLLTFQPLWGVLHHLGFKSKQRRTGISYVHIWLGRIAVILGMINGRLGIRITGIGNVAGEVTKGYTIAYMIVVAVMGTLFIASAVYGELRGSRRKSTASDSINS
jgi:RP/EB family microtubule-associated protein